MLDDKHFYNQASAAKLGWTPEWFGCSSFGDELIRKIKQFQMAHRLTVDGLCGPGTYRRMVTERDSKATNQLHEKQLSEHLIYDGRPIRIDWPKVVLWTDKGGLRAAEGAYKVNKNNFPRRVTQFVNHWDVCLNSRSCLKVLNKRGISVHFLIDNDGTIYQTMDIQDIAWHAGSKAWNEASVGVEITNAYYTKYNDWYEKNGHGKRPVIRGKVHGYYLKPHLGFYDIQMKAAQALWMAIHRACRVPLECPTDDATGEFWTSVHQPSADLSFSGIIHHYHLKKNKIDCAGMDLIKLIGELK